LSDAKHALITVYRESRAAHAARRAPRLSAETYDAIVTRFVPWVARTYPGLGKETMERTTGDGRVVSAPPVAFSCVNTALVKLMKAGRRFRSEESILSNFQTMVRQAVIDYFRGLSANKIDTSIHEHLKKDNDYVALHQKDPRSFLYHYWKGRSWPDSDSIPKDTTLCLYDTFEPAPFWEVLKHSSPQSVKNITSGELVCRYALYLLETPHRRYLRFRPLAKVVSDQFQTLREVSTASMAAGAEGGDEYWWAADTGPFDLDARVIAHDLATLVTTPRERLVLYLKASGLSFPEMEAVSKHFAAMATPAGRGLAPFGKSTAQSTWKKVEERLVEEGYGGQDGVVREVLDIIAEVLNEQFGDIPA
jgi:hypothetical protein